MLYLVERPGVLVTREELFDAVWPDVAVTPDTLSRSISELRRALGDMPTTPRFIETVHRRGIRFIAQTGLAPTIDSAPQAWRNGNGSTQPFVGRTAEVEQLADCFAKACAGERQIVFVTGPAGVGKTTLVEAFLGSPALHSAVLPVRVGRGACIDQHGPREPYMPVLEALERMARQPDAERLHDLLRRVAPTWLAQMPWLIGDDAEALRHSLQTARAERMLREFASLTEALTTDVPLVLVLEDLHWSDPSTVDLLALLGQRREAARLFVIGIYRPAEIAMGEHILSRAVRTLQVRRQCVKLPVSELTEADVGSYLHARFRGAQLPPDLSRVVHKHTDGNPLFVVAIVEHMLSRGWVLDTSPGWAFTVAPQDIDLGVPDDARRIIATQFERLAPADQSLLRVASVAGTEFAAPAIAAPLGWALDDVEARCETLAHSQRFLRDAGASAWPDGSVARRYAFTHELHRQAVYEGTPAGSRQRFHRHVGEALEAAYGERATEVAGELATHFERGHDCPRALRYLTAAAARARQRFAHRESAGYLEAAIALAAQLPDEDERRRRELDLRVVALAPVLTDVYGFASEELRQNCERASDLCREVGNPAQLFQILYVLCHVYSVRSDPVLVPATLKKMDELARASGTVEHGLIVNSLRVRCSVYEGRFTEACDLADSLLSAEPQDEPRRGSSEYGTDPLVATRSHRALALWFLGHTDRATAAMDAVLAAARSSGSISTRVAGLSHAAILALLCRNPTRGRDLAEQVSVLAAENGLAYWNAMASALKGWATGQQGHPREAIAKLEAARALHCTVGIQLFYTFVLAVLAEAHLRAGKIDAGLVTVDEGLRSAETTLDRGYWPELWRLKGELLLAASAPNHVQEAEQCLRRALDLAREAEAKALELRAATSLARLLLARGRAADARALLDGICSWFGAGTTSPDLIEARSLLQQLSPAAP